eukprot:TRINITY_DN85481_c0_g1_i1.p4 TRINITY_DN85481_c0_g1~~TRINITY_DN85481_c0_g1_i1.p4  ORF type:complete len:111 (+),score=4.30 TRINITY_DN85481_c0_g1_i1:606-938(+)
MDYGDVTGGGGGGDAYGHSYHAPTAVEIPVRKVVGCAERDQSRVLFWERLCVQGSTGNRMHCCHPHCHGVGAAMVLLVGCGLCVMRSGWRRGWIHGLFAVKWHDGPVMWV